MMMEGEALCGEKDMDVYCIYLLASENKLFAADVVDCDGCDGICCRLMIGRVGGRPVYCRRLIRRPFFYKIGEKWKK